MEKIQLDEKQLLEGKIPGEETGIEVRTGLCGFCGGSCAVDIYCRDGRIVKVEGNDSLPFSNGRVCVKGAALKQSFYHPDRILYPMKRVGERGKGKFARITWDEALSTIADRLRQGKEKYGAEQTFLYVGHPKWFRTQLTDFANAYGTPNFGSESSTCAYALMMANQLSFGEDILLRPPDFGRCKTLLAWGVNPLYSNSVKGGAGFLGAVKRGAAVIAVDPRATPTTEHAHLHLRPIPGTDGALALGMARVLLTEGLYDADYIRKYTTGFEAYREYAMTFSPDRVEKITGVPAEDMARAARMIAANGPCTLQLSASPIVHNVNGVQNARAINLLMALTGNFGIPGGFVTPGPGRAVLKDAFLMGRRRRLHAENGVNYGKYPVWDRLTWQEVPCVHLADYLEGKGRYPIRNLISFGMNHHMWPRPDHLERALKQVEFFVNADIYQNDTCRYADILLPVATSLEREQIEVLGSDILYYQPKAMENLGETRNDMEILLALADKLGIEMGQPALHTYEEYLKDRLAYTDVTLEELRTQPQGMKARKTAPPAATENLLKVKTPTGKIEFVSTILEECGKPGLPVYRDFRERLPMAEYPLILNTGSRRPQLFHSRTYRMPWLSRLEPYPVVDIHPLDAEKWNFRQDETAILRTPVGRMEFSININTSCLPGVVNVYHGAGSRDINYLLDENWTDPISGFPGYKSYCCRLEKKEATPCQK